MGEHDHTDGVRHLGGLSRQVPTMPAASATFPVDKDNETYQVTFWMLPMGHTELAVGDVMGGSHTSWAAPATRPAKAASIASLANMASKY